MGLKPTYPLSKTKMGNSRTKHWREKVIADPETGCWNWIGSRVDGYGVIRIDYILIRVHRLAYTEKYGPPKNLVCHHCDKRLCCNPAHLYDATYLQNGIDAGKRGRMSSGERNGQSILIPSQVLEIRKRHKFRDKENNASVLAREFGVSIKAIRHVVNRDTWKHI